MREEKLVDVNEFMELTGYKKTFAYEMFKNKDWVRQGILVKTTPINKSGGWRVVWHKYMKWSKRNAEMVLDA